MDSMIVSFLVTLIANNDNIVPVVMTEELYDSRGAINPYGGRVCWLENFGTDEGGWTCREIGRFPGINSVKGNP